MSKEINEEVNVRKIIKDLGDTDWGKDNDAQAKAVQLLKGIAFSDDPMSNEFMKDLSDASTKIAKQMLATKTESNKEKPVLERAVNILDGIGENKIVIQENNKTTNPVCSRAMELL